MPKDYSEFEKRLKALKEELEKVEGASNDGAKTVELDQQAVGRLSRMNDMQSQAMGKEAKARRIAQLQRIEEAFERIKNGTYGLCVYCKKDIPLPRLEFDPTLLTCINCANR